MREWIPATDMIIQRWGKDRVPHDMHAAIHDVWENLDLSPVKWPTMLLLIEDGVEEPGVVDHLGRVGLVYDLNTNSYVCWSPRAH